MKKISIDNAMMASLGVTYDLDADNIISEKVASLVDDTCLEKIAGIYIDKPTLENCEEFIRKYMYNELSFFPRILELNVNVIPSAFDKGHSDHIDVASGVVQIKVRSKIVEIPFLIRDGELVPFDVIQMDGQRAPYSRENLQKIIINLDKAIAREESGEADATSPYKEVSDHITPATSPGFMGDALSIRDTQSRRNGKGMFVVAGEEYSDMEKVALFKIKKVKDVTTPSKDKILKSVETQAKNETDTNLSKQELMDKYFQNAISFSLSENFKSASEKDIYPFAFKDRGSLESQLDKAKEKIEKEKPTTKAPAGTVEKDIDTDNERGEEKLSHTVDLDSLIEKVANLKPMTDKQYEALAYVINKKAYEDNREYLNKIAEEIKNEPAPTRKELALTEKANHFKFDDISIMDHGDYIVFPEMINGEFSLTPAIVFKNTSSHLEIEKSKPQKFIMALDGRIKLINGDKFLCKKADEKKFNLPRIAINQLQKGDRFFVIDKDLVSNPYTVEHVYSAKVHWEEKSPTMFTRITCKTNDIIQDFSKHTGDVEIVTLANKKFERVPKNEFILLKSREIGVNENDIRSSISSHLFDIKNSILSVDPEQKVFKITGEIINFYKSSEELNFIGQVHDAGYELDKIAFSLNTISVQCVDRGMKLYNVTIEYKDTESRLMNLRKQNFNRISEEKLKAILRIVKFQGNKVREVIFKAKNEPNANFPIPADCTIEDIKKLEGGNITNVSANNVKNVISKYVNPNELGKNIAKATISGLAMDAAFKTFGKTNGFKTAINFINKMANESAEISAKLEKLAQDKENEYFLDMAKVALVSNLFHEKLASVIEDNKNYYPDLKGISREILQARPVLEKMAYDLTTIKVNQTMNKVNFIDQTLVNRTINSFDSLYKTASEVFNTINESNLNFNI